MEDEKHTNQITSSSYDSRTSPPTDKYQDLPTDESFETLERLCDKSAWDSNSSDDSFETLERMCDKSASDPNSTLFRYLQFDLLRSSNDKESDIESFELQNNNAIDVESKALQGFLTVTVEDLEPLLNDSPIRAIDCTQLEDIEEPTNFWDDTMLKTSSFEKIGLLQPSTTTDLSLQISFQSALEDNKIIASKVSTGFYGTENDNMARSAVITDNNNDRSSLDVDHLFYDTKKNLIDLNDNINLIDLKTTMEYIPHNSKKLFSNDSNYKLFEDDKEIKHQNNEQLNQTNSHNSNSYSEATQDSVSDIASEDKCVNTPNNNTKIKLEKASNICIRFFVNTLSLILIFSYFLYLYYFILYFIR